MRRSFLIPLLALAAGLGIGHSWRNHGPSDPSVGRVASRAADEPDVAATEAADIERLASIGYLAGSQQATGDSGVTVLTTSVQPGLNFYVSGHGPEAVLMDNEGHTLHRWHFDYERAFPDAKRLPKPPGGRAFWRRALLLPDGDVLAIFEGEGLIRIDHRSQLRWAAAIGAHHDLFSAPDGRIWVLTRKVQLIPRISAQASVLEDSVSVLDESGKVVREISILQAFWRSEFGSLLDAASPSGDPLHTNAAVPLVGGRSDLIPAFRQGNLLLSIARLNALAILDPDREEILWALVGMSRFQHTPSLVASRGILLLDNRWQSSQSRAIEIDPVTQKILWRYEGTPERPFHTEYNGAAYRLDNGNSLLVESGAGRAIEVDSRGRIVWEFRSPHRTHDGRVATLFDLRRIDPASLRFSFQAQRD